MTEEFIFTPREAQPIAKQIANCFEAEGFTVSFEKPISKGSPYTTTMLAIKGALNVLVEVQHKPEYHKPFRDFVLWLRAERTYTEMYLGVSEDAELNAKTLAALKEDGIGILFAGASGITFHQHALNPALTATIHPDLRLGHFKERVMTAIETFNTVNNKHGLQEMCEIVEDATRRLLRKAISRGWIVADPRAAEGDWSDCINLLAAADRYTGNRHPLCEEPFKNDLHSFRGARNLVNHPAKGRRQSQKAIRQCAERMAMGPRLVAELVTITRRVT